jgi:hypothetical protein
MLTEQTGTSHDPIARLLASSRGIRRACADLAAGDAECTQAMQFMDTEVAHYRRDLEQALFPLLKRRLRREEDEEEENLRHEIFRLDAGLADLEALWRELESLLERRAVITDPSLLTAKLNAYGHAWDEHLEKMTGVILPALHARLGACDLDVLGQAMAQHRGLTWEALNRCPLPE